MPDAESVPIEIVRAYHDHWRAGRFEDAARLLADNVSIETPINIYETREEFVAALTGFGALVAGTSEFIELANGENVVQLYDMDVDGLGLIRIAEHFVVRDDRIVRLRQIHDTAALRDAGFERRPQFN